MFGLGVSSYSYARYWEPEWLEVSKYSLKICDKPLISPIKILHLSDLHASETVSYAYLKEAVSLGLSLEPDIICLTGDYITHEIPHDYPLYQDILRQLPAAAPTFASFGNHDGGLWAKSRGSYDDISGVRQLLDDCSMTTLVNESAAVSIRGQLLNITGLGDAWADMFSPQQILRRFKPENQERNTPVILLSHNPDTKDWVSDYEWDLMLSGHTHGGQIRIPLLGAPFAPVSDKRYTEGLHRWKNRWLHITRGVGTVHGVRINCRPQVSLLEII